MKIRKQNQNGILTLKPFGRIDTATAPELAASLEYDDVKEIVFDLSEVDYVSSAGLRIFLTTHQKMEAAGGKMTISGAKQIVTEIFDIAGFSDTFHLA